MARISLPEAVNWVGLGVSGGKKRENWGKNIERMKNIFKKYRFPKKTHPEGLQMDVREKRCLSPTAIPLSLKCEKNQVVCKDLLRLPI